MAENELSNPWEPTTVRNPDIVGAVERADKYAYDMCRFESASINEITEFDINRILSYNGALRVYIQTLNEAPATDNPHSYPGMYSIYYLTQDFDFDSVKNKAIRDIVRQYVNLWVNLSRSESADKSIGYLIFDYNRAMTHLDRIDFYIESYIKQALPLDLPESSAFEDSQNS